MNFKFIPVAALISLLSITACSDNNTQLPATITTNDVVQKQAISNYADIALANYKKALTDAQALEIAINTFVAQPTDANFTAAKAAWLLSRESYGTTEAFRFANGPIDAGATEELEGLINSWPLDEAYVDYVLGDANAGIINNSTEFPVLSKEVLSNQNGSGGDEEVTTGYHAIEFLLWGQDLTPPAANLPGQRPYTDYVDGGTASNQERRREYLSICADLLTDNLQAVVDQWNGDYRTVFLAKTNQTNLNDMLSSIAELSRSELAIERIAVALISQNQEDEHSCFSDNTHRDIRLNLQGISNVYNGNYGDINSAVSLNTLIRAANPELGAQLSSLLSDAQAKLDATYDPFDIAISGGGSSPEGAKVQASIEALVAFGDKLLEAKSALGLN